MNQQILCITEQTIVTANFDIKISHNFKQPLIYLSKELIVIIKYQDIFLRDGDRFWKKNSNLCGDTVDFTSFQPY